MRILGSDMFVSHPTTAGEQNEIFVSAEVIAKRYSVTSRAVLLWAAAGVIPCVRIGSKTVRFSLAQVRAALENASSREKGAIVKP